MKILNVYKENGTICLQVEGVTNVIRLNSHTDNDQLFRKFNDHRRKKHHV